MNSLCTSLKCELLICVGRFITLLMLEECKTAECLVNVFGLTRASRGDECVMKVAEEEEKGDLKIRPWLDLVQHL